MTTLFRDFSTTNLTPATNLNIEIGSEKKFGDGAASFKLKDFVQISPGSIYNPHLIYSNVPIDMSKDWTIDFWLKIKPGRPVSSSSDDEYFMAIDTGKFFRLDTQAIPCLHCSWLGVMGNETTGVSGPLTPDVWYYMTLIHRENSEWYFHVDGIIKSQGIATSETGGGGE